MLNLWCRMRSPSERSAIINVNGEARNVALVLRTKC